MAEDESRQVWQLTDGTVVIEGEDTDGELTERFASSDYVWLDTDGRPESPTLLGRARHRLYKILDQL